MDTLGYLDGARGHNPCNFSWSSHPFLRVYIVPKSVPSRSRTKTGGVGAPGGTGKSGRSLSLTGLEYCAFFVAAVFTMMALSLMPKNTRIST